jgi:glyoxylase-like metal-dependent hydrolase (beta-lactamase superfamily II)
VVTRGAASRRQDGVSSSAGKFERAAHFVWTRALARVRVAIISEGAGWWPVERALEGVPEGSWRPLIRTDDEGRMAVGFNIVHLALPGASVLLDAGLGTSFPTPSTEMLISSLSVQPTPGLQAGLASVGVDVDEITHVLVSHLHADHIMGATRRVDGRDNPVFRNARYYVMADEWNGMPADHHVLADRIRAQKRALLDAGAVELARGACAIAPGVDFLPAPGESPGHAVVRIDTGDGTGYFIGDLYHHPAELLHLDWLPRGRDRQTLVATRKRFTARFAAERAWLIPSHFPFPAIGCVAQEGEGYRWQPCASGPAE